ncbi:MAG: hypothetical protein A2V93_10770 [Ignavibacteria bacterium RBG_16_34_14]|nr:MAG: hypothetical protein A2V93_10770 [Ignavibacteria bacterium RBG_16_34_14]
MPELSRFMGMVIHMYYDDHSDPHFHVREADNICRIDLNGNLLDGNISLPKLHIVKRWTALHHDELLNNWKSIRNGKQPERIKPWQ